MPNIDNSAKSKRIAKNTLLLYMRMIILMIISLYTSRVILNALGVEDYGINNVVGGLVSTFSIISASLDAAINRFLTFELGTGNIERLKKIFSTSVTIQVVIAIIVVLLAETIGLWFINNKMVIASNRLYAANWCFQFSLLIFVVNLISVPYRAAIIAHERMSVFAYISIFEAVCKLFIAWLIMFNPIDRLIYFVCLGTICAVIIRFVYTRYCFRFEECRYRFYYNHDMLKQMFGFAGWSFIGASSMILRDNGGNILLNLFFGTTVNAARGVASSVNTAISSFVNNFMVALDPQIIKSYASDDRDFMFKLAYTGARLSTYILWILCLPVLLNTNVILVLWLKLVPEHAVGFIRLILVLTMCETISSPLVTIMLATGKIRNYQLVVGGIQLLNFPLALLCFYLGFAPESIYIVAIVISQLCLVARLLMLKGMVNMKIVLYLRQVYFNVLIVIIISLLLPLWINSILPESLMRLLLVTILSIVSTIIVEFFIGCSKDERFFVLEKIKQYRRKFI